MYKAIFLTLGLACSAVFSQIQEPYLSNQTYTWSQLIQEYQKLDSLYPKYCSLESKGYSDFGELLHVFIINKDGVFEKGKFEGKAVLMINNGIHPGEPEGIDAAIKLAKDLLQNPERIPQNVVIGIVPLYNIGGAHNRHCCSRANQNGPEAYGFRGSSKNMDLNRDFIKADTKNTLAFYKIYQFLKPHVLIDTHTSNGADYQYTMTLITSQTDKMTSTLRDYTLSKLNPAIYTAMADNNWPMIPYVTPYKQIPDDGIVDYLETPRYSTGYANLFNTIGLVAETHMLKPFKDRVEATYALFNQVILYMNAHHLELIQLKKDAEAEVAVQKEFGLEWTLDTTRFELIDFMGYEAEYSPSGVTGEKRLSYNQNKPFKKPVRYYNRYAVTKKTRAPRYYVIPQAWDFFVELYKMNEIQMYRLTVDIGLQVETYLIANYETIPSPYEGHYMHYNVQTVVDTMVVEFRKGDYVIPVTNKNARFIVETLEPQATDSYMTWNYFDAVLQQKEWFSAYVFEDEAEEMLNSNPQLKAQFEKKKAADPEFAKDAAAQLYFIYKNSSHYEPTHNRYPVVRFNDSFNVSQLIPVR